MGRHELRHGIEDTAAAAGARGHPVFAVIYSALGRYESSRLRRGRARLLADAHGDVLEVGAGGGANLRYYPTDARLTLTEPDPHMRRRLARSVVEHAGDAEISPANAEALPFPDRCFDAVVCTLVLCSVERPLIALGEMRRVLRPGGRLLFIEHVRATDTRLAWLQDLITPLWGCLAGGCHPNRRSVETIREADFIADHVSAIDVPGSRFFPHVQGIARRPT